jgi:hypothetical protein
MAVFGPESYHENYHAPFLSLIAFGRVNPIQKPCRGDIWMSPQREPKRMSVER